MVARIRRRWVPWLFAQTRNTPALFRVGVRTRTDSPQFPWVPLSSPQFLIYLREMFDAFRKRKGRQCELPPRDDVFRINALLPIPLQNELWMVLQPREHPLGACSSSWKWCPCLSRSDHPAFRDVEFDGNLQTSEQPVWELIPVRQRFRCAPFGFLFPRSLGARFCASNIGVHVSSNFSNPILPMKSPFCYCFDVNLVYDETL